jgi:protein transport protein HofC
MIGNEVPLPEALRLTAGSLRNASLARGCRRVAAKVEAGQLLSDGIAGQRQFPARFVPVIAWGERSQSLAESFRAIAGMCDEVLHVRAVVAQAILLPVFLLGIMTFIGVCLLALFMPLLDLVTCLSSPKSYSHQHHSDAILATDLPYEWIIAGILAAVLGLVFVVLFTQKNWASGCGHETWLLTFLATLLSAIVWGIGLLALLWVACFFLGLIGFVLWGIFVGVVVELFRQRRSTRQYSLLWLLTVSVEKGIPLSPTVAAFAGEFQGKWRYQTMRLAAKLAGGISLPEALEQLPGLLPAAAIPLVRVGCDAGNLATALQKAGKGRLLCHTLYQSVVGKAFYLACVAFFAICCYTFIGYKIIPSFEKMLSEFGLKPPLSLVFFVDVLYLCCDSGLAAVLFLLVLFVLIYWGLRYFDVIQWRLPGVGWFVRNLDRAVVLDTLALSAAQGQPLTNGLDALAQSYPDGGIRSRLQKAAADIARGRDWMGSLFARGLLGRADSAVLRTAQQVGNLSWAMEEMADSNRRRFAYRGQIWLQVLFPAVILLLGVVVMFVVVPVFSCLISLIEHLV